MICVVCGRDFDPIRKDARCCGSTCRAKATRIRHLLDDSAALSRVESRHLTPSVRYILDGAQSRSPRA